MAAKNLDWHRPGYSNVLEMGVRSWFCMVFGMIVWGIAWGEGSVANGQVSSSEEKGGITISMGRSLEELYAQWGKVAAELQAARRASPPDAQRIAVLMAELQKIRGEIWAEQARRAVGNAGYASPPVWCPWGLGPGGGMGLGLGLGRGPAGGGFSPGRGQPRARWGAAAGGGPPWARGW